MRVLCKFISTFGPFFSTDSVLSCAQMITILFRSWKEGPTFSSYGHVARIDAGSKLGDMYMLMDRFEYNSLSVWVTSSTSQNQFFWNRRSCPPPVACILDRMALSQLMVRLGALCHLSLTKIKLPPFLYFQVHSIHQAVSVLFVLSTLPEDASINEEALYLHVTATLPWTVLFNSS